MDCQLSTGHKSLLKVKHILYLMQSVLALFAASSKESVISIITVVKKLIISQLVWIGVWVSECLIFSCFFLNEWSTPLPISSLATTHFPLLTYLFSVDNFRILKLDYLFWWNPKRNKKVTGWNVQLPVYHNLLFQITPLSIWLHPIRMGVTCKNMPPW